MPLLRMPDGQYVNVADGTPPDVLERIKAQHSRAINSVAPVAAAPDPVQREMDARAKSGMPGYNFGNKFADVATFGVGNKIGNALVAGGKSLAHGTKFADEYGILSAADKEQQNTFDQEHPLQSLPATAIGALFNPVGAETGVGRLAARFAPGVHSAVTGSRFGQGVGKVFGTSIGQGVRAGANYGAVSGALDAVDDPNKSILGSAANEAIIGGGSGGILGGAFGAAGKVGHILADRMPENAGRVAYGKIATMLGRSHNPNTKMPFTPGQAVNEIKATNRGGGDAMLMDIMPEATNTAAYLSRKPGFRMASELEARATDRAGQMGDRFDAGVRNAIGNKGPIDAFAERDVGIARRKAQGKVDYAPGGAMDDKLTWSPELDKYMREAPPATELALKNAYMDRLNRREMPAELHAGPNGTFTHVPDLRTLDYVKRAFDNGIKQAVRAGDNSTAGALSGELNTLKAHLTDANPKYADILKNQRDEFQKQQSMEMGMDFLKRLGNDSRGLLKDMRSNKVNQDSLKLGIADALLHMREKAQDPVKMMRRFMRSTDQRRVLQHAFGSNKTLNEFDQFIRREVRTGKTDRMVSHDQQSITNILQQHGDANEMESAGQIGKALVQGYAFGGNAGALSRGMRALDMLQSGIGPAAQEKLAQILMSKGKGVAEGVGAAKKYAVQREAARIRRSQAMGRVGAALTTGNSGE